MPLPIRSARLACFVFAVSASALGLAGCRGKLTANAELHGPGSATARFTPASGKSYVLWADTEGTWNGGKHSKFPAAYAIDVEQGGKRLGHVDCDARGAGMSVCGSSVTIGGEHSADCELKLGCALPHLGAGEVVLHVHGRLAEPATNVKRMSLVVREE